MSNVVIEELTDADFSTMMASYDLQAAMHGFRDHRAVEEFKHNAASGLVKFGGGFAAPLGEALAHADVGNTFRLIIAFRDMLEEHAALYIQYLKNR